MEKIFLAILAGFMMISVAHAADTIKDVSGAREVNWGQGMNCGMPLPTAR